MLEKYLYTYKQREYLQDLIVKWEDSAPYEILFPTGERNITLLPLL